MRSPSGTALGTRLLCDFQIFQLLDRDEREETHFALPTCHAAVPLRLKLPFVETVGYLHTHGRASQRRRQDARVRMLRHVRRNGSR